MKETTEEYIAKLKAGLATLETALYKAKMSAQEVNTRKNKQIAEQQAEIEALKKDNKELHAIAQRMAMAESDARKSLQWFKDAKDMNNEPYGWVKNGEYVLYIDKPDSVFNYVPLYTHPVKELTDKEILEICDLGEWHKDEFAINFARAILRKAQEK